MLPNVLIVSCLCSLVCTLESILDCSALLFCGPLVLESTGGHLLAVEVAGEVCFFCLF